MIADHANTYSESVPHPFTLNDLRVHNVYEEEPTHTSTILTRFAMIAAAILAIGAFVWLDPLHLHLFTPAEEKTPTPAAVATAQPAQPPVTQEIAPPASPTPVPATKSAEGPTTPAPAVRAPQTPAVRSPAVASKAQSGSRPADKMNSTVARAPLEEKTAPPIIMTTPEERTPTPPAPSAIPEEKANPPIVAKPSDDANSAPKPAAASAPTPATE